MGKSLSNKYYICKVDAEPIPWNPSESAQKVDLGCTYFGQVFEAMEKRLNVENLTFYFTWDTHKLPSYGQNVVAVVNGDEWCRIPTYFHKVRAVFKCYGTRPILGCNPLIKPSYLNFITLLQFLRAWFARLPGWVIYKLHQFKKLSSIAGSFQSIYDIPLGYYNQLNLPIKNIECRRYDVFFAGSLVHGAYPFWSIKYWLREPKRLSRQRMISIVNRIEKKNPDFKFELSLMPDFKTSSLSDAKSYSEKLMNAKICLVPRGTSYETFRFFEALRYGCIVVTEALPSRWFYEGSPAIQITDWNELETILEKLLKDQNLMQEKHEESLNWWKNRCSEAVVGEYMAEKLNSLSGSV